VPTFHWVQWMKGKGTERKKEKVLYTQERKSEGSKLMYKAILVTRSFFWNLPRYLDKNMWLAQIVRVLQLRLSTVELDKSNCQVALVSWNGHTRLRPLLKSLDKWQYVKSKSTWKVTPLKSCVGAHPKKAPQRSARRKVWSRSWPKRKSNLITSWFFFPNNFQWKRCSWNHFFIDLHHDSDTKGHTSLTWICRKNVWKRVLFY